MAPARRSKLVVGMCSMLHMALVLAVMYLYDILQFFIASVPSFFFFFFFF